MVLNPVFTRPIIHQFAIALFVIAVHLSPWRTAHRHYGSGMVMMGWWGGSKEHLGNDLSSRVCVVFIFSAIHQLSTHSIIAQTRRLQLPFHAASLLFVVLLVILLYSVPTHTSS